MDRNRQTEKAGPIAQAGALTAAILASACCWLPLLLIAFGVSGGALSAKFEALRPVLLPVTFVLLALAFYFTYRKPGAAARVPPGADETCCVAPAADKDEAPCCPSEGTKSFTIKKLNKVILWVLTVFVLAFALFPNYVGLLVAGKGEPSPGIQTSRRVEWEVTIGGMTCQGCAARIASSLQKIPGVAEANVAHKEGIAVVVAAPTVSESDLRRAVEDAGYSVLSAKKKPNAQGGIQ
jgi:copper chaperone CopZ